MGLISRVSSRTYREKKKKKMAKRAQVEAVIKTIIREIIDQCALEGHSLSESLVAFMVKAVVIDPSNGLSVERPLTDNDIQELITNCVRLLTDKKSCSLETVRMQVFFDMNYTSREEMLDEHNIVTHRRLAPMSREICDSKARTRNDYDLLYRKIVAYVILSSGLGSPTDLVVVRETTAALHSVYPQTELANFVALQTCDKQIQLDELCQIVTGIRLFNKDCNKGGTGIDNVPQVLNDSIPETTQAIDTALANAQESLDQFFNKSLNQVDEFLIRVNSLAAQSPELIGLMGLSQQFTVAGKYKGNKKMRPLLKRDSGVQTDTHFHDTIIDPNYHWNEWELRRKAIRLANLTHKITHSSQTIKSHFRWE